MMTGKDNLAWTVFGLARCFSTETAGMSGIPVGLKSTEVDNVARKYGIDPDDPDLYDRLRVIVEEYCLIVAKDQENTKT